MTVRLESCPAGDVSAHEAMGYPEVSGVSENRGFCRIQFPLFLTKRARVVRGWGEVLAAACRQQVSAGCFFSFFLLGRALRGALPVGCTVETKQRKLLRTKTIRSRKQRNGSN